MRRPTETLYKGWKIITRCTEFRRKDGSTRFVSSAVFETTSASHELTAPGRTGAKRSFVHTEDAFCTCDEAKADAIARAHRSILALDDETMVHMHVDDEQLRVAESSADTDSACAARYEISFDGKRYSFREFRYDRFQDALRYATLEQAKVGFQRDEAFVPHWAPAYVPSGEEEQMMQLFGIDYVERSYLYGGYRYDALRDAIAYAQTHPGL